MLLAGLPLLKAAGLFARSLPWFSYCQWIGFLMHRYSLAFCENPGRAMAQVGPYVAPPVHLLMPRQLAGRFTFSPSMVDRVRASSNPFVFYQLPRPPHWRASETHGSSLFVHCICFLTIENLLAEMALELRNIDGSAFGTIYCLVNKRRPYIYNIGESHTEYS